MKRSVAFSLVGLCILFTMTGRASAQGWRTWRAESVRFFAVDVYVNSLGMPLGAYQIEIADPTGASRIVGIEGGGHRAFHEPPFYDRAALQSNRVIIAAYSTLPQLPRSRTRVATLHLRVVGEIEPELLALTQVAISAKGTKIPVTVHLEGVGP